MFYTVKEVAEKYNISPYTLRYYTDEDLIPGVVRDEHNHRLFNEVALKWLRTITAFRNAGMSVKLIQHYLELFKQGEQTIPERYELLLNQQQLTQQKLNDLKEQLEVINEKVRTYYDLMNNSKDIKL